MLVLDLYTADASLELATHQQEFVSYFFLDDLEDFFFGTLAPSLRAWESPIAIACLRLVTFLPDLPLFRVPFFRSCIAFSTFLPAFLLYLAMDAPFVRAYLQMPE
jgi:hypothetical protein